MRVSSQQSKHMCSSNHYHSARQVLPKDQNTNTKMSFTDGFFFSFWRHAKYRCLCKEFMGPWATTTNEDIFILTINLTNEVKKLIHTTIRSMKPIPLLSPLFSFYFSGLDAHFESWNPSLFHVLFLSPPFYLPLVSHNFGHGSLVSLQICPWEVPRDSGGGHADAGGMGNFLMAWPMVLPQRTRHEGSAPAARPPHVQPTAPVATARAGNFNRGP